jgi:hypothetical protein
MRRLRIRGLPAALVLGLGLSAAPCSHAGSWMSGTWPPTSPPAAKPPATQPEKAPVKPEQTPARSEVTTPETLREQELAKLLRRQGVCIRLTQIALETNDVELQKRAEQLDERAYALYLSRTGTPPAPSNRATADEAVLDKRLPLHSAPTGKPAADSTSTTNLKAVRDRGSLEDMQ